MANTNRLTKGQRVNLWLEEEEYKFYKHECREMGLPFIAWVRSLLRRETGWRPSTHGQGTEAPTTTTTTSVD